MCFPYVPKSTSFVSPTLYFSVFPALTALAIVFHESSAKETVFVGYSTGPSNLNAGETPLVLDEALAFQSPVVSTSKKKSL